MDTDEDTRSILFGINRIRLEFKAMSSAVIPKYARVLIESDWNLKEVFDQASIHAFLY